MNQNFGEEEPEQLHEKLEPSSGRQQQQQRPAVGGAGGGDTEPVYGAPKVVPGADETIKSSTDDDQDDQDDNGPLSAIRQHDAAPKRAANALTSLFAHVDKGKSRRRPASIPYRDKSDKLI